MFQSFLEELGISNNCFSVPNTDIHNCIVLVVVVVVLICCNQFGEKETVTSN